MKDSTMLEIAAMAKAAGADVVKAQIAAGKPAKGMSKARHVAVVANVCAEMLASYATPEGEDAERWPKQVLQAALSGSLLNASQFRQELEAAGILAKETAVSSEYGL